MERRVSKKFKPSITKIYQYKKEFTEERPKGLVLKYWIYDDVEKEYIGVLRKPYWILEFMLVILLILVVLVYNVIGYKELKINVPDTMYCSDNRLEVNITNDSEYNVKVIFTYSDIYFYTWIRSRGSVGTVLVDIPDNTSGAIPFDVTIQKETEIGVLDLTSKEVLINIVRD